MPDRPMLFVDLEPEGRSLTYVPLPGGLAVMALACEPGDAPFDEEEDGQLRQRGFTKVGPTLYAALASDSAGAVVRLVYDRGRTVDFDEAAHVRGALPAAEGEDAADLTLRVGTGLALAAAEAGARRLVSLGQRGALDADALHEHAAEMARLSEAASAMAALRESLAADAGTSPSP